jgi:hypothetical protein
MVYLHFVATLSCIDLLNLGYVLHEAIDKENCSLTTIPF